MKSINYIEIDNNLIRLARFSDNLGPRLGPLKPLSLLEAAFLENEYMQLMT